MKREIRRVDPEVVRGWPLGTVWPGLLMPDDILPTPCTACDQSGLNPETQSIQKTFYDHMGHGTRWNYEYGVAPDGSKAERGPWRIMGTCLSWRSHIGQDEVDNLVAEGRLMEFTHTHTKGEGWVRREDGYRPTFEEINEADRSRHLHDAINRIIMVQFRAKKAGVYGLCKHCAGDGEYWTDPEQKDAYMAWNKTYPKDGQAWQLWETVSDGSPVTPTFETAEELIEHLVAQGDCTDQKAGLGGWVRAEAVQLVAAMNNQA